MSVLVGRHAPKFKAQAVVNGIILKDFTLEHYLGKKNVLFFFYPLDFTFVCPTELHAFEDFIEEFDQRDTQVVGCSVDSCYSHLAWLKTPKSKGGIEGVSYPLVSDLNKTISGDYGVLIPHEGIAYRGLFLIDKKGVVRHQVVNDLPLGRSVDEALRTVDALIYFEQHGEVCPANWQRGKQGFKPSNDGLEKYFAEIPVRKK